VEKDALKLVNAAEILGLSYRQMKRIWRRYQEEGAEGLQHRSVGRESGRKKPKKFRLKVLRLVRQKYSGEVGERFGPTLAAEHLGRGWDRSASRNFEALDVGGRVVESDAEEKDAPQTAGTESTLW
jgi:hypothetical protein